MSPTSYHCSTLRYIVFYNCRSDIVSLSDCNITGYSVTLQIIFKKISLKIQERHQSGFVTILGKPNAGKSTLLNAILGRKLSIITPKAQTTRHRIFGIDTGPGYQMVFSDTPGLIRPKYRLHQKMMGAVHEAVEDADVLVLLVSMDETFPEEDLLATAKSFQGPCVLVVNKADLATQEQIMTRTNALIEEIKPAEWIIISALTEQGVSELKTLILKHLPDGPAYYDADQISDRPERFFIGEMIREKIFLLLKEEIPYSCEVEILKYQEGEDLDRIHADIHVERKSQKGILIGKQGTMLKRIGSMARKDIEEFLGKKVFLELYVRVTEDWKDRDGSLRGFGYE